MGNKNTRPTAAAPVATEEEEEETRFKYLVVGGGNAAGYVCKAFAEAGRDRVAVICEENVLPYERPALTKAYLHPPGAKVRARLPGFHTCVGSGGERQTQEWYDDKGIRVFLGTRATAVDVEKRTVQTKHLQSGRTMTIVYETMILATGARALTASDIRLENADLENIFHIRNEYDASMLVEHMEHESEGERKRALIMGGGYIGMETAAALSGWGYDTTVVLPEDRLVSRLFTPEIASWIERYFSEKHGIKFIKGQAVSSFIGNEDGKVIGAKLKNEETIDTDLVIVGIGARVNTELVENQLEMAPKPIRGVVVNGHMQTSNPNVYAIGDLAAFPNPDGGLQRHEHVHNCRQSAAQAVASILDDSTAEYEYLPYFYSRLFEYTDEPVVFKFYGTNNPQHQVIHFGDLDSLDRPRFGALWLDENRTIRGGLLCNAAEDEYALLQESVKQAKSLDEGASAEAVLGLTN